MVKTNALTNYVDKCVVQGVPRRLPGGSLGVHPEKSLILDSPGGVTRGVIRGVILRKTGEDKCVDTCVDTCVVQGGPGERSNLGKLGWHAGKSKIFRFWAC